MSLLLRRMVLPVLAAALTGCAVPKTRASKTCAPPSANAPLRGSTGSAAAEDDEARRLLETSSARTHPESAVQIALLNNPALQAAYEDLGVAQADVVQAGILKNPTFLEARISRRSRGSVGAGSRSCRSSSTC